MDRMPKFTAVSLLSSTLTLQNNIRPSYSLDSSSTTGAIIRHGPHQTAQKSTRTGRVDLVTSVSNTASLISLTDMIDLLIYSTEDPTRGPAGGQLFRPGKHLQPGRPSGIIGGMYYETLFRRLNEYGVKYVVCGGVAVILHGVDRYTKDTDLLVDLAPANLARLWDALATMGYKPVRPVSRERFVSRGCVRWLREEKHAVVFSFAIPEYSFLSIDVMIESPVTYQEAKKRAAKARMDSLTIPLVSIQDLIRMKEKAQREKDLSDIRALKQVRKVRDHAGKRKKKS